MIHARSNEERFERLGIVEQSLVRRRAFLASVVLRLGQVHFVNRTETAAILAHSGGVTLFFNPRFFDACSNGEIAGVLAHEALHLVFDHPTRMQGIVNLSDRRLFEVAAEAVVNDTVASSFPEFPLPGRPITGPSLVGCSVAGKTVEQVMRMLKQDSARQEAGFNLLFGFGTTDEHDAWWASEGFLSNCQAETSSRESGPDQDPADGAGPEPAEDMEDRLVWNAGALPEPIAVAIAGAAGRDAGWGDRLGQGRLRADVATDLAAVDLKSFLLDQMTPKRIAINWSQFNRKLSSVYPRVILPVCEECPWWNVLIAIDCSGSVPDSFVAIAMEVAGRRMPNTSVELVAFDVNCHPIDRGARLLPGGGGTRVQAVEEHATAGGRRYPDAVFLMTDGLTPPPSPRHPERWVWILPPGGNQGAIPKNSRRAWFATT